MKMAQQLRLLWIDGHAATEGRINRSDLCEAWEISNPQATNDMTLFCELYPGRLVYDVRLKCYIHHVTAAGPRPTLRAAQTIAALANFIET